MKSKILLIGIDGLNLDTALDHAPTLVALKEKGFFAPLTIEPPTWSGPSWSTLLTG
jgi:predicted AlkP superfamily pyrophosphatase or phosphodiesterase